MYKLSVVIPAYNAEKTIKRCLESVFNNDYKDDVEVIVVNDCSTDNTLSLLKELEKSAPENIALKIVDLPQNSGASNTRNVGLSKVSGEYVAFLDADDEFKPDFLSIVASRISDSKVDVLCFNAEVDDNGNRFTLLDDCVVSNLNNYGYLKEILCFSEDGFLWNHVYRRSVIQSVKPESLEKLTFTEDLNINLEIARKKDINFSFFNDKLYVYYFPQGTHIARINYQKMMDALYIINKRYEIVKSEFSELLETYKVGNLKSALRLVYAVKKTDNFTKKERKEHLKFLRNQECIKFTFKLGFKRFMKLPLKDKIRYILYK